MELTFTKDFTRAVRKWLKNNAFDCSFTFGSDLQYLMNTDEINIPHYYDDTVDTSFMKYLRKNGLKTDFDTVTLSILHELGHAETMPFLDDEEINNYFCELVKIGNEYPEMNDDYLQVYWDTSCEKMANDWLIKFANNFIDECQELEDIVSTLF